MQCSVVMWWSHGKMIKCTPPADSILGRVLDVQSSDIPAAPLLDSPSPRICCDACYGMLIFSGAGCRGFWPFVHSSCIVAHYQAHGVWLDVSCVTSNHVYHGDLFLLLTITSYFLVHSSYLSLLTSYLSLLPSGFLLLASYFLRITYFILRLAS